jgi:hypothetical protein
MEWVLWFALAGTEQAIMVTPFKTEVQCKAAAEKLRIIEGAVFDCWKKPKGQ